jgi:microcystin-dependent protein
MKRVLILLAIGLSLLAVRVRAQTVPSLINYQGQVLGANGTPLATGDYELTFRILDAAEGGTLIWGPQILDGTGGVGHGPKIPVVQGYFNVMLGPTDTASRSLSTAFQGPARFLEIKVGTNNPISPRQQILSAPYALNAANAANAASVLAGGVSTVALADGAVSASKVADGSIASAKLAQEVLDRLLPSGTIVAFGGSVAPAGWVLCDGSVRSGSDSTFSALFAAIAKTYGIGDGTTTSFNVPDLRGRAAVGAGQGTGLSNRLLAGKFGTETEAITQVPAHTHALTGGILAGGAHTHRIGAWLNSGGVRMPDSAPGSTTSQFDATTDSAGSHTHSHNLVIQSTGGAVSVNNVQPSIALNYIIKL